LAEGTYRAALKIGEMKKKELLPYAVQSKGISIGAHGIRSGKDYPGIISYACSVQGGDHTSTAGLPLGDESELMTIFMDSGIYCMFNAFGISSNLILNFYKAVTGKRLTKGEWVRTKGLRILEMQRALLLLGGPDVKWNTKLHDDNPPRFYELLPSGPYKDKTVNKIKFEKEKRRYYRAVGWDRNGIPKSEILKKLGLSDVDKALKRLH
nr:aldehyde ferredoxin oxidoreductase C-terminal domain-containing protein [Candidatus Njordarchaeum guaymaensis]